jgi:hypothetical protein
MGSLPFSVAGVKQWSYRLNRQQIFLCGSLHEKVLKETFSLAVMSEA